MFKKLFQKILFPEMEKTPLTDDVNLVDNLSIYNEPYIKDLAYRGSLEELKKITPIVGVERIKCNQDPLELATIHWAAATGNLKIVEFLLSETINENPNLTRGNNFSPLHSAAMNGFTNVVKLLIERGADVNIQTNPQKYAPIHSAAFAGHLETIKVLISNGADLNLRNYKDERPIDLAKRQNQFKTIRYLTQIS